MTKITKQSLKENVRTTRIKNSSYAVRNAVKRN